MQFASSAVVIGASAGALEVLTPLLAALPPDYPEAILIAVHLHPHGESLLSQVLQNQSEIVVEEAEDKIPIEAGKVFVAPRDYHLQVEPDFRLSLSVEAPVHYSRPSIDVLFETAADVYRQKLTGIILTGANADGAAGLKAVLAAGGSAIIQNPAEAEVAIMPSAAIAACPEAKIMGLEDIIKTLLNRCNCR